MISTYVAGHILAGLNSEEFKEVCSLSEEVFKMKYFNGKYHLDMKTYLSIILHDKVLECEYCGFNTTVFYINSLCHGRLQTLMEIGEIDIEAEDYGCIKVTIHH